MKFLEQICKSLGIQDKVFSLNHSEIQDHLAPILRKQAIAHLSSSKEPVATGFRAEYVAAEMRLYQDFLNTQAKNGSWGTYIEAAALGEKLGCHVVVTAVNRRTEQKPFCIYRAQEDNAPTVHLYNRDNTHWYVQSRTATKGNGNCLYNAFAQALKKIVAPAPALTQQSFLHAKGSNVNKQAIIHHQMEIAKAIKKSPTPENSGKSLNKEMLRISRLSNAEQKQIAQDHQLALDLAREEMSARFKY